MKVPLYEPTSLLDINFEETEAAANESILMDPQVLEVVLDILKMKETDHSDEESKLRLQTMKTFFVRGLFRVLDVLKEEFLENLEQFGLLESLIQILLDDIADKEVGSKDGPEWF